MKLNRNTINTSLMGEYIKINDKSHKCHSLNGQILYTIAQKTQTGKIVVKLRLEDGRLVYANFNQLDFTEEKEPTNE